MSTVTAHSHDHEPHDHGHHDHEEHDHHHHHHGEEGHVHSASCGCGHDHSEAGLKQRLLFVIAGGACMLLSVLLQTWRKDQSELASAWGMIGALLAAMPIFFDTARGLASRAADNSGFYMNQFTTLAVVACFASGQYLTGGVVAIVLLVGHIFEDRSMLGTNEAIQSLLKLSRVMARRVKGEAEELIDAESLAEGDLVRIRPGDTIPADGTVTKGHSAANQASITGESLPAEVEPGSPVFAGTSNLTGVIEVRVTRTGERTILGRVKDIVEEAQQTRAPIIRLTEEYARYYMPLVLLIAGFVLFFTRDLQRAISVLVVSIPCTFVLAGPAAMVAALAAASRMGILIKSVRFFEAANEIDAVVFDKTGTLTTGELRVAAVTAFAEYTEDQILALVASVEAHSTHPIARAIVSAAATRSLLLSEALEVQEKHGHGLSASLGEQKIIVGRAVWLKECGITAPTLDDTHAGMSALLVAVDQSAVGVIYLSDTVRPEAMAAIAALRRQGIEHFTLLTGDRQTVASALAAQLEIGDFEAECLPEGKLEAVRLAKELGRKVMVVGDGVNDAPALAAGNLGVAMGALGSDIAIQTADVALMASDLKRLPHFLALSKQALRIINQNMLCGFIFIGAAIVLSGVGLIPPIAAAFVHELGAFFVIFNSARLLRFEGEERPVA